VTASEKRPDMAKKGARHLSGPIELLLGYQAIGLEYTTGSGNRRFLYDMTTFGPQLGIGFHF
jgi:hypothetical protein